MNALDLKFEAIKATGEINRRRRSSHRWRWVSAVSAGAAVALTALLVSGLAIAQSAADGGSSVTVDLPTGVSGVGLGFTGVLSFWFSQFVSRMDNRFAAQAEHEARMESKADALNDLLRRILE